MVTDRLILRPLSTDDGYEIFSLRSDERVNKYLDRQKQTDPEQAKAFIKNIHENIGQGKSLYWAICFKNNNTLIGTICLFDFSEDKTSAEIGFELNPAFQKQGLMGEALQAVVEFAFKSMRLKTIHAFAHRDNDPSKKLLEKNRFMPDPTGMDEGNSSHVAYRLTGRASL